MRTNIDPKWLQKMAEREDNKITSAGGHVLRMAHESREIDLVSWSKLFPLNTMRKLRFSLPDNLTDGEAILNFFGVSSPQLWKEKWASAPVAFRQTQVFDVREEAVSAWVREAEIIADQIPTEEFDIDHLQSCIAPLRSLTNKRTDESLGEAQLICAAAGVALVVVPGLPGTRISGCTRWLSDKRVLIGLSMRYKTDDQLWYTFFHELGHVLLHRDQLSFVIDNAADTIGDGIVDTDMETCEREANEFASEVLIPSDELARFLTRYSSNLTSENIYSFAESLGIGPGIVVGRLQHDGILEYWQGNDFKQNLNWGFTTED